MWVCRRVWEHVLLVRAEAIRRSEVPEGSLAVAVSGVRPRGVEAKAGAKVEARVEAVKTVAARTGVEVAGRSAAANEGARVEALRVSGSNR